MDYLQPCKKYKYFAATTSGEMPTKHKYEYNSVLPDLDYCKKGWPDRAWRMYRLVYVQKTTNGKREFLFDRIDAEVEKGVWQQSLVPSLLAQEINEKWPDKAVRAER